MTNLDFNLSICSDIDRFFVYDIFAIASYVRSEEKWIGVNLMNAFIQQMINQKINSVTPEELLRYGAQYGFQINPQQAKEIVSHFNGKHINIFNDSERNKVINALSKTIDPNLVAEVNKLFLNFIKGN